MIEREEVLSAENHTVLSKARLSDQYDFALARYGYHFGADLATQVLRERPAIRTVMITFAADPLSDLPIGFVDAMVSAGVTVGLNCVWLSYVRFQTASGPDETAQPVQEYRTREFENADLHVVVLDRVDRPLEARLLADISVEGHRERALDIVTPLAWTKALRTLGEAYAMGQVTIRYARIADFPSTHAYGYRYLRDGRMEWIDEERHDARIAEMPRVVKDQIDERLANAYSPTFRGSSEDG